MFLESSRSKFIGYTLGRWVPPQSQPGGLPIRGGLQQRQIGWGQRSPELAGSFLRW